ncbi:MAG: dCTP deaminase [Acidimicrobiales bacterium]
MDNPPNSSTELHRSILHRASAIDEIVGQLRGPLAPSRRSLRDALDIVGQFPDELRRVADQRIARNPDERSQTEILVVLLRHANAVATFIDRYLAHGTRRELSEGLVQEVRRELQVMGLSKFQVVLSHGEASNFVTRHGNLKHTIFRPLLPKQPTPGPPAPFAFFQLPRIEGAGVHWRPILLGHEAAHVAVDERSLVDEFRLTELFDRAAAAEHVRPASKYPTAPLNVRDLYRTARSWTAELLCDLNALERYGPAAVAALGDFLITIGAFEKATDSHPPGVLRLRFLVSALGEVSDPRLRAVLDPWRALVPPELGLTEPWAQFLATMFDEHLDKLESIAAQICGSSYQLEERSAHVHEITDRLAYGIPGTETVDASGVSSACSEQDVVNAAWLARAEAAATPIDALGRKAIESLDFLRRWTSASGELPVELYQPIELPGEELPGEDQAAALSADLIAQRLRCRDSRGLVLTPLTTRPKGSAIDLRLGNRFIVFRRTGLSAFNPLDLEADPRSFQVAVDLSWDEDFVLHPGEVVLGATLEYVVLPDDLCGQVVTRSSYGRLGLLSATGVQVHPSFHGCLTLELVNLSNVPLALSPGERIAQLVLWRTKAPKLTSPSTYEYPCGPEFSQVRRDPEAEILRRFRDPGAV